MEDMTAFGTICPYLQTISLDLFLSLCVRESCVCSGLSVVGIVVAVKAIGAIIAAKKCPQRSARWRWIAIEEDQLRVKPYSKT